MGFASQFDLVYLYVRDLDRSVAFYREVLGLALEVGLSGAWAEARLPGGFRFALNQAADYVPPTPRTADLCFRTESLERAKDRLAAAGVSVSRIEHGEWGDHFHAVDPDGYRLSFYST